MTLREISYRGWPRSLWIGNGVVEAVVVPAIGRVMEFRWTDHGANVIWTDESLNGQHVKADVEGWKNFGGDKVWPLPQSGWQKQTGRAWPPPPGFDSLPFSGSTVGESIVITSAVDIDYGIQTVRSVKLEGSLPVLSIATEFRKVAGSALRTGIWAITQMCDAERVFALLPESPVHQSGYTGLMGSAPKSLEVDGRLLSLGRDREEKIKIRLEAKSLLWVGKEDVLRIEATKADGEPPEPAIHSEIYTNPDPLPYVELEILSPLETARQGDVIRSTSTYTLARRREPTVLREAARVFGL